LLAMSDGYRESEQSWQELLLHLKQRELQIDPKRRLAMVLWVSGKHCRKCSAARGGKVAGA